VQFRREVVDDSGVHPRLEKPFMKSKTLTLAVHSLSLVLVVSATCALAQQRPEVHFNGVINDYSPASVKGGPWEMHGQWSMDLHGGLGKADFYADMTMSGYGLNGTGMPDGTMGGVNAHTHHIRLTNVKVTWDMIGCPAFSPPTTMGFQVTGTVSLITGNGGPAPFEPAPPAPPTSMLTVCVTGGTLVPYSNVSMVFTGPATTHFGTQAIHGVVRKAEIVEEPRDRDDRR
jgi:hypothetical protein